MIIIVIEFSNYEKGKVLIILLNPQNPGKFSLSNVEACTVCPSAVLGKLLYESNILHITSYFYKEETYYSYILLNQKSNFVILLLLSKVIILCNLVTSY